MDFFTSIKVCFRKYFNFSDRAQRSEYWWFYLFTILASIALTIVDGILFGWDVASEVAPLSTLFSLVVLIPTFAAGARRLHDTNRTGWFQLLPLASLLFLIPALLFGVATGGDGNPLPLIFIALFALSIIGLSILLIVWLATDSDPGPNKYGGNPKGDSNYGVFD